MKKAKKFLDINSLKKQISSLDNECGERIYKLQEEYSPYIDDFEFYDDLNAKFSDIQLNYINDEYEILTDIEKRQHIICAKWAAKFLIATNIARRGKLLHPDTAIRKLYKYNNSNIKYILDTLTLPVLPFVLDSEPYLSRELYQKYNVLLLNKNLYMNLKQYIKLYPEDRKSKQYANLLKKFHKNVIQFQNTLSQQNVYKPF